MSGLRDWQRGLVADALAAAAPPPAAPRGPRVTASAWIVLGVGLATVALLAVLKPPFVARRKEAARAYDVPGVAWTAVFGIALLAAFITSLGSVSKTLKLGVF